MTALAAASTPRPVDLTLSPSGLHITDFTVTGSALEVIRQAARAGDGPEEGLRRVLDVGGSVLLSGEHGALLDAVDERVDRLIDAMDSRADTLARLRAVADTASAKGAAFEDLVAPVLERCFAPFGDIVEDTSRSAGADGRSKHGDFTITLASEQVQRVVVEAKDRPTLKLTGRSGALAALRGAMENRDANVGILVCATATPALSALRLRLYGDDQILVLLNKDDPDPLALEIACHLARALAARSVDQKAIDATVVAQCVTRLREILDAASDIRRGCQEAARAIDRISGAYDDLRREGESVIGQLAMDGA
jgi:hypothetical protein